MTTLAIGAYGTLTFTTDARSMSTRVTSIGTLTLPAGTWRVLLIAADTVGGSSTVRTYDQVLGSTTVVTPTDLDHMSFRGASSGIISVAVVVQKLNGAAYEAKAAARLPDIAIAVRGSAAATPIGVHTYIVVPDGVYTTARNLTAEFAAAPSVEFVRVGLPWCALQPSSSAFDATNVAIYDAAFAAIAAKGWKVQMTVGTTPSWARSGGTNISPPTTPSSTFAAWVDSIIDRWGGTVDIISIDPWNEANNGASVFNGTLAQYVQLVQAAHSGAQGRVPVAVGALAGAAWTWLDSLFDNGLTSADFEGVDFHPYTIRFVGGTATEWMDPAYAPATVADRVSSPTAGAHMILATLAARGITGKTLWVSEIGTGGTPYDTDPKLRMPESLAAQHHATILDQLKRMPEVGSVAVHLSQDVSSIGDDGPYWYCRFGLLRSDLSRRQKWATVNAA